MEYFMIDVVSVDTFFKLLRLCAAIMLVSFTVYSVFTIARSVLSKLGLINRWSCDEDLF